MMHELGVGLCGGCVNARRVESRRGSVFLLCELSKKDPRFPKYPALPVVRCPGYEREGSGLRDSGARDSRVQDRELGGEDG